jgi:hypothetical protein
MGRSAAIAQKKLDTFLAGAPGLSVSGAPNDMTKHMLGPLEQRPDGKGGTMGYTPDSVRSALKIDIEKTRKTHGSLTDALPPVALALNADAMKAGNTSGRLSTRTRGDQFGSGTDYTLTRIDGVNRGGDRAPSDTPQPQSPRPEEHGQSLVPDSRYERAHQNPFQFTGKPGNTVWAPTQGNQVVDTHMERFVSGSSDAYLFRQDTPTHSTLTAVRTTGGGGYESQQASYQRRPTAAKADGDTTAKRKHGDSSPSPSASSSSTTTTTTTTHTAPSAASKPTKPKGHRDKRKKSE